jgi:hypothetical protein
MWRRMHSKEYYDHHSGSRGNPLHHLAHVEETRPFIPTNGSVINNNQSNKKNRSSHSATSRQFHDSPQFQRLTNHQASNGSANNYATMTNTINNTNKSILNGTLSTNGNHSSILNQQQQHLHTATINSGTLSRARYLNLNNSQLANNINNTNTNLNEYSMGTLNTDSYLIRAGNNIPPTAPPSVPMNGNF